MFIFSNSSQKPIQEADDLKVSCEVHGGNLFVKLHFKAIKNVPDSAVLINTAVSSNDESSAEFGGYGQHLIAIRQADEESYITKDTAFKYIKSYVDVMFGTDVGNSLSIDDIEVILENGEIATPEDLKKWDEQQKNKDKDDNKKIDESIPSFRRFIIGEDEDEDEDGGDSDESEDGGDEDESEDGGDEDEAEDGGDGDESEEGGEEIPPPSTFLLKYKLKADGQPEKDHTDPKELSKRDKKFKLPGIPELGLEFRSGGATVDTVDLKKLGKELGGKMNGETLETMVREQFKKDFPDTRVPTVSVRDKKSLDTELKKKFEKDDADQYDASVQSAIQSANYSLYIEVEDFRLKPHISKQSICEILNSAFSKMGGGKLVGKIVGQWFKYLSKISEDDVIMLKTKSASEDSSKIKILKQMPTADDIKNILYDKDSKLNSSSKIWSELDELFEKLTNANSKIGENIVAKAIEMWKSFKQKHKKPDSLGEKEYKEFYTDYQKYYKDNVSKNLSESYQTKRCLLNEVFGFMYGESDDEDFDSDDPDDSDDSDDKIINIFIVPIPKLEMDSND